MDRRLDQGTVTRLRPPAVHRRRHTDPPVPVVPSERSLLLRASTGDVDAWEVLVDAHLAQVWRWAVADSVDRSRAEEVCELVWLRLAETLPQRVREPLLPWLRRTVAREAARGCAVSVPAPRDAPSGVPGRAGPTGVASDGALHLPPPDGSPRVR